MSFEKKTMYKYEVANMIGVSSVTLARWLNGRYFDVLQKVGYNKYQKYLTAKQIKLLNEILDFL